MDKPPEHHKATARTRDHVTGVALATEALQSFTSLLQAQQQSNTQLLWVTLRELFRPKRSHGSIKEQYLHVLLPEPLQAVPRIQNLSESEPPLLLQIHSHCDGSRTSKDAEPLLLYPAAPCIN